MPEQIELSIGPYRVESTIAKSGTAVVFKAIDPASGRPVAVKVAGSRLKENPEAVRRFLKDGELTSRLNHPNIVRCLASGMHGEDPYLVLEYVPGTSLDKVLAARRMSLQEALTVIKGIAQGLGAAHQQGLLHGNLKPRNVLLADDLGTVKISDFGTSRLESIKVGGETLSTGQMSVGTVHYASPEVAHGSPGVDQRADLFSLGVIFYELLTGRAPSGRINLPSQSVAGLPTELDPIVLKCLAQDREQRYGSAAALLADLSQIEQERQLRLAAELEGISRTTKKLLGTSPPTEAGGGGRPPLLLIGGGLAALIVLGLLAFILLNRKPAPTPAPAGEPKPADAATAPAPSSPASPDAATPPAVAAKPTTSDRPAQTPSSGSKAPATRPVPAAPAPAPEKPSSPAAETPAATADAARQRLAEARALEDQGKADEALAAYADVASRFPASKEAGEALYRQARVLLSSRRKDQSEEARKLLAELISKYPESSVAVPALMQKAAIEEQKRLREVDPLLKKSAPAALGTYRTLAEQHGKAPAAEEALWKMGEIYEDLDRHDLAAQAFADLGTRFPGTRYDAWYRAGTLYEKKLKDPARAKQAYAMVPQGSARYKDAQERLRKL